MNFYRTGGDIGASFSSILGEAYATIQYNDHHTPDGRPDPFSHPGCWAYPDMQEIGNFQGPDPLRSDEERTHWGLWVINSAPLILGLDMNVSATMDRIWSTITNTDALAISDAWAGHPGTLVKTYPAAGAVPWMVTQAACDGSPQSTGWKIENGLLVTPGGTSADSLCLGTGQGPIGQNFGYYGCPPPTTGAPDSGCGLIITNCSDAKGVWSHDAKGTLRWAQKEGAPPKCLSATPTRPVGNFYGGPVPAETNIGGCPGGPNVANTSTFAFSPKGELRVGSGVCLVSTRYYGAQLWSKPLPGGKVAVLVVNLAAQTQAFALPLADVPSLQCGGSCAVRDVWAQNDLPPQESHVEMQLREHESGFYILGPSN